ncbi:MAG: hypothetical protein NUW01_17595, partial [Gemmatimonadaceae bacterium]|nr:hypothetical protein [Gemmatimonadaceae bacterium]
MRRRTRAKPHHPQPHRPHARRQQLHSMLLAGATFFVPHAGKPPASRPVAPGAVTRVMHTPVGT